MRERIDPVRAAQANMRQPTIRRFYKEVEVREATGGGFELTLDGRPARTPGRHALASPSRPLMARVAEEWARQGDTVDPADMPVTRLLNSAIDGVAKTMDATRAEIARYAGSDLLCYRAEGPETLAERQRAAFDPVLRWAADRLGARFHLAVGVVHVAQPPEAIAAVRSALDAVDDPVTLAALSVVTNLTGSALLALAVHGGLLTPAEAWAAAHVDEDYQNEQWGVDEEASARRASRWRDMQAAADAGGDADELAAETWNPSMENPIDVNRQMWDERAHIHAQDRTGGYRLDRIRAGEYALHTIEEAELGDVSGKRVLHLQCHIGSDTLCLAGRGAKVTGLDFSQAAVDCARRLADETGLQADFVRGTVDEAPRVTRAPFDLVFTTWGTICWLPDVSVWARVIASVLKPGGELYFADAHPGFLLMEEVAGRMVPTYDFQTPPVGPLEFVEKTTYTGDPTVLTHQSTWVWIHPVSAVVGALIDAGLTIVMFHEHEALPWQGLPMLIRASDRLWRLPDGHPRFPLSYSLRARKG